MSVGELVAEVQRMKGSDKISLLEVLWETAAHDYDLQEIPVEHQTEIQDRHDKYAKGISVADSWDTAKESILKRYYEDRDNSRSSK